MALSNAQRIGRGLELLGEGLRDVVDEHMQREWGPDWNVEMARRDAENHSSSQIRPIDKDDVHTHLRAITEFGYYFKDELSRAQQSYAQELREIRNDWAHQNQINTEDTYRALDSMERLLRAVGSIDSANDVLKLRQELDRVRESERHRNADRRATTALNRSGSLKPWREVIQPHDDVAQGHFSASEFAADLHLVHTGELETPEYADPREFFSRTFITEGLRDLLGKAVKRMAGDPSASPVVNLQTNFGGGKTHSMLALYHLFGGYSKDELTQDVATIVEEAGNPTLEDLGVRRAVLVGTYLQAGAPIRVEDGIEVNTIWGELAWQLGGRESYELIAEADRTGTNPGDALRRVIQGSSPCLILIDEWVAYARQLHNERTLRAGTFDTQFTFAQTLTETVKAIPGAMLVVSVPASDSGEASDIETGGEYGRQALERLQNVLRRSADPWRPSNKQESFEIVRRRLFKAPDYDASNHITATASAFVKMYRENSQSFPSFASDLSSEYEARMRASYPLHPELLDRLYDDWSSLERFQRTRGVLKLVAAIVHQLWQLGDESPMILPGNVPLGETTVNTELSQYLEESWKPIIDSDIDGARSIAHQIDDERSALKSRMVTQRVARTIFMGSAPRSNMPNKGLDKQYVWLGTAVPGDVIGNFGVALEQLERRSTYFYTDQGTYWFGTSPSLNKTARDIAEQLREDPQLVWDDIVSRLRRETRDKSVFVRVHVAPAGPEDVPDDDTLKLVIVPPSLTFRANHDLSAQCEEWVRQVIDYAGRGQREFLNRVVFLAADVEVTERLMGAVRHYLAWKRIEGSVDAMNLTPQLAADAKRKMTELAQTADELVRDAYAWVLYPSQFDPHAHYNVDYKRMRRSSRSLAEDVARVLETESELYSVWSPEEIGRTLHTTLQISWSMRKELSVRELWETSCRYSYMPRLQDLDVLTGALREFSATMFDPSEVFALASGKDPQTGKYRDIRLPYMSMAGSELPITADTLLIDANVARQQFDEQRAAAESFPGGEEWPTDPVQPRVPEPSGNEAPQDRDTDVHVQAQPKRYYGTVKLSPATLGRDFMNINREIIDRLQGMGADLEIRLDIQATKPSGFDDMERRVIGENSDTLRFTQYGFEKD